MPEAHGPPPRWTAGAADANFPEFIAGSQCDTTREAFAMTTLTTIEQFLSAKTLALAGASRRGRKFGNLARRELAKQGWQVLLVHPTAAAIDGCPCVARVADLPRDVGGLVVSVPPAQAEALVREAAAAGLRRVWLQRGSESPAAIEAGRAAGLEVIHGQCILMHANPGGIHRVHRWLVQVAGRLPKDAA